MPKTKPHSIRARIDEADVTANITAEVTAVAVGANAMRGNRSSNLPQKMRKKTAVAAETLKKHEAASPSSLESRTKVSCPASVRAKSAAVRAKSVV